MTEALILSLLATFTLAEAQPTVDADARDASGRTALMWAALTDDAGAVAELLAAGADPNLRDPQGNTALVLSAGREPAIVRALLEAGADVNLANDDGRTPLIAAAQSTEESVRLLLDKGADVAHRDELGLTALTVAEAAGAVEVVSLLREAGAKETPEDRLNDAVRQGDEDSVRRLVAEGADVNALDTDSYQTPLMTALKARELEIVQQLVDAGADPTREGTGIETTGDNAIVVAAREGNPWALRLFLSGQPRRQDLERVLFVGCADVGILRVALDAGARVSTKGAGGETPLQCAAAKGATEAVQLLLEAGADPRETAADGTTAKDRAERAGHGALAALLERAQSRPR